jgi:hypothetical protein
VVSGSLYSGVFVGAGLQLRWISSGGNCYVGVAGGGPPLSGGFMTITSGGMQLSGGAASGMLDGMLLGPGDAFFVEPGVLGNRNGPTSGTFNVWALCDQAASGVGRLYFAPWLGFRG